MITGLDLTTAYAFKKQFVPDEKAPAKKRRSRKTRYTPIRQISSSLMSLATAVGLGGFLNR